MAKSLNLFCNKTPARANEEVDEHTSERQRDENANVQECVFYIRSMYYIKI